jgi:hypothetical protein
MSNLNSYAAYDSNDSVSAYAYNEPEPELSQVRTASKDWSSRGNYPDAWGNLDTGNKVISDYQLNGVVTSQVRGSIPLGLEFDLQRGQGVMPAVKKDNRSDIRMFQDMSIIELDMPILSNEMRAGANSRDDRVKYTPASVVVLPEFGV